MIRKSLFACFAAGAIFAGASDAGEVADRCAVIAAEMGLEDTNGGCTCFENAISDDDKELYMLLENEQDWDNIATDAMHEAIAACFPAPEDPS